MGNGKGNKHARQAFQHQELRRRKMVEGSTEEQARTEAKDEAMKPEFSFCEGVWASSFSPWHIRQLTAAGKKLGGGADTKSLCGREMSWDLETEIGEHRLSVLTCQKCLAEYRKAIPVVAPDANE